MDLFFSLSHLEFVVILVSVTMSFQQFGDVLSHQLFFILFFILLNFNSCIVTMQCYICFRCTT